MEKTINKNYLYKGKILNLRVDDVLVNNKNEIREVVEHSGGICILVTNHIEILFVKQYRYCFNEEILELPAGKIDEGETPIDAAIRELREETSMKVNNLTNLGKIYPTVGYTNEEIYLYMTDEIKDLNLKFSSDEISELVIISINEVKEKIKTGEIKDAKTVCAILKYLYFKDKC